MDDELNNGELLLNNKNKSNVTYYLSVTLAFLLSLLIVFYLYFSCAIIDGRSMENTLDDGQITIIQTKDYSINRGDIITLKHPADEKSFLIKRVIGVGGDKILFVKTSDGNGVNLYIKKYNSDHFELQDESYIKEPMLLNERFGSKYSNVANYANSGFLEKLDLSSDNAKYYLNYAIDVPQGSIYYLGDNRNNSTDSRWYGTSEISSITGKVVLILEQNSLLDKFFSFLFSV